MTGVTAAAARRRRPTALVAKADPPENPIRTAGELGELVTGLRRHSRHLEITVETLDLVRALTLLPATTTVDHLVLTVTDWERPLDTWQGRPGPMRKVLTCAARYPRGPRGQATVDVKVGRRQPLADIVRAVYPLLAPDRGQHGYGFLELATIDAPAGVLALLPSRTAPGLPGLPSSHLRGVGLADADLALVGSAGALAELTSPRDDTPQIFVRHPLLVQPDGHLAVSERTAAPVVDLNVHNPIGRLYAFAQPSGSVTLTLTNDELAFRVDDSDDEVQAPASWTRPAALPLSEAEVRALRTIESVDLRGLTAHNADDEVVLLNRLAELAATGTVLHDLPTSFARADDVLGAPLAGLLQTPYQPTVGLLRDLRSVPQRREAMLRFGGFFELADQAAHLGHRLLPSVSVVLSTMRPARAAAVLRAMAAQSYPHLEIAVSLHGLEGPVDADFEEAVKVSSALVATHDRSTPFGTVLAETARRSTGDLVVKIDDDDAYGPRVVEDLVLAYLYSNADVVGKTTEYLYFEHLDHTVHRTFVTERYHSQVAGGAMLLSRGALNEIGGWRPSINSTDRSILIRLGNSGGLAYRTHSLGYVYVRHSDGHTWKQGDSLLLRNAAEQWARFMPEIIDG